MEKRRRKGKNTDPNLTRQKKKKKAPSCAESHVPGGHALTVDIGFNRLKILCFRAEINVHVIQEAAVLFADQALQAKKKEKKRKKESKGLSGHNPQPSQGPFNSTTHTLWNMIDLGMRD